MSDLIASLRSTRMDDSVDKYTLCPSSEEAIVFLNYQVFGGMFYAFPTPDERRLDLDQRTFRKFLSKKRQMVQRGVIFSAMRFLHSQVMPVLVSRCHDETRSLRNEPLAGR